MELGAAALLGGAAGALGREACDTSMCNTGALKATPLQEKSVNTCHSSDRTQSESRLRTVARLAWV